MSGQEQELPPNAWQLWAQSRAEHETLGERRLVGRVLSAFAKALHLVSWLVFLAVALAMVVLGISGFAQGNIGQGVWALVLGVPAAMFAQTVIGTAAFGIATVAFKADPSQEPPPGLLPPEQFISKAYTLLEKAHEQASADLAALEDEYDEIDTNRFADDDALEAWESEWAARRADAEARLEWLNRELYL